MKLKLQIIEHPVDKTFPKGARLALEMNNKIYVECVQLDSIYIEGDKGLEPKHLASLFNGMAKQLSIDK